jgi:UDP-glucose 4-epimerase
MRGCESERDGAGRMIGLDVVTGGGGFIGSHLVDSLLAAGRRVRVLDRFPAGRRNLEQHEGNPRLELVAADVSRAEEALRGCEDAERIFHLAARADIVASVRDPGEYFRANVDGTFNVLEAARRHGAGRFVYAASSSCYGIAPAYPTPESAPADPRYPYALTKYLGEQLVLHWNRVYGVPAVSLRLFNVYGPRARANGAYGGVFEVFVAQLLAGEPLTVVGDGEQTRDFIFVTDAVAALRAAADRGRPGEIYNVGSGAPVSVNELVRRLGSPPAVHVPKRPGEPDCTWADITKIRRDLGWAPTVSFAEGVRAVLDHAEYWRNAPVWTPAGIREAAADWFKYLGASPRRGAANRSE